MSDKRDKAFVRESIDQGLSSLEGNPFLAQRVLAQANGKEEIVVKKKISVSFVLFAVLLFLMTSIAVASSLGFMGVNWFGKTVESNAHFVTATPMPVATATPEMSFQDKFDAVCQDAFDNAPNRELVIVSYEHEHESGSACVPVRQEVQSLENFYALTSMNPDLVMPQRLPDGYGFMAGIVFFDCKADGEYVLASQETTEDGITIKRYHADEADLFISGYRICLADERVDRSDEDFIKSFVSIDLDMNALTDPDELALGSQATVSVRPVHVNGMDQALAVEYPESLSIKMRCEMPQPIFFKGLGWINHHEIDSYGEYHVNVNSETLSEDEMIRMFDD